MGTGIYRQWHVNPLLRRGATRLCVQHARLDETHSQPGSRMQDCIVKSLPAQ